MCRGRWYRNILGTLVGTILSWRPCCDIGVDSFANAPALQPKALNHADIRLWESRGQNPSSSGSVSMNFRPRATASPVNDTRSTDDLCRETHVHNVTTCSSSTVNVVPNQAHSHSRRRVIQWSATLLLNAFNTPAGFFSRVQPAEAAASVAASTVPRIPYSSLRRYKRITLRNGLPVLLVSDKSVSYCQAAMAVPAGQFYDGSVPGLAHLMEHMLLSTPVISSSRRSDADLESWLMEQEGASNAFTANKKVCFHFTCPKAVFAESLERFAAVFRQKAVETVCRNRMILRREIRRVDSELNFDSVFAQEEYLTKAFINLEHPYSVFSKGSIESLELKPIRDNVNVSERLIAFFRRHYLPHKSFLVVIGAQDVNFLERWVAPFSDALAVSSVSEAQQQQLSKDYFPGQFLYGSRQTKQLLLKRTQLDELPPNTERLTIQWILNLDYRNLEKLVTVHEVAFILSQILGRRGPGSLYLYLKRRGWIPDTTINSLPRISIPVDVSGFQIMKLELRLTSEGFVNRGNVVDAIFESIKILRRSGSLPRNLITQYASVAKLFGYHLAPRPPDAVELAFDALVYDQDAVSSGLWYRFPTSLDLIRRTVGETVDWMSEPENALIIVTTSSRTLKLSSKSEKTRHWLTEPISGASFDFDDTLRHRSLLQTLASESVYQQELLPPFFNPLIPNVLERPHTSMAASTLLVQGWLFAKLNNPEGFFLPKQPIDSDYGRCAFVVQFLSPKPARANVRQAARGELWKLVLEEYITDLTELGATGGLGYDISFNKFGIRFAFLGVNQTLPSYIRRMFRRVVEHRQNMLQMDDRSIDLTKIRSIAISSTQSANGLSPGRRARIISNLRTASFLDIGKEGSELFDSIIGAVAISQGDFEAAPDVIKDINSIFAADTNLGKFGLISVPPMGELCYKANWKPRFASGCYVPGVNFMSDACGRIPR